MYYKVSLNVDITPNYSEEMYVVVKIEPIDKKPPEPPKEQFEYSPALTFEETLALIVATAGLILLLGPYAIAFVKSIGVRALAGAIL